MTRMHANKENDDPRPRVRSFHAGGASLLKKRGTQWRTNGVQAPSLCARGAELECGGRAQRRRRFGMRRRRAAGRANVAGVESYCATAALRALPKAVSSLRSAAALM